MYFTPTPVEPFRFGGRVFYVKRDDLSHPLLSGNKFRKLYKLIHSPSEAIDRIVSYGGTQSNAMLSIAALSHIKGWRFEYTSKSVPARIRQTPEGNLRYALELGMQLHEVHPLEYEQAVERVLTLQNEETRTVVLPQGGADPAAGEGITVLAEEIKAWQKETGIATLTVATPSGTGTTAAYLARSLETCTVVTVPSVGDATYLRQQIGKLMPFPENLKILSTEKCYRFAAPHIDLLKTYEALKAAGIIFDLLYAPVMWKALLEYADKVQGEILYVHSGGVLGNDTMLERYALAKKKWSRNGRD